MPTYEFINPDGEVVEAYFHMSQAPKVGESTDIDGIPCERIFSAQGQFRVPPDRFVKGYSLPVKKQMDPELAKSVQAWDADGTPCFNGNRAVQRFLDASRRLSDTTNEPNFYSYGE